MSIKLFFYSYDTLILKIHWNVHEKLKVKIFKHCLKWIPDCSVTFQDKWRSHKLAIIPPIWHSNIDRSCPMSNVPIVIKCYKFVKTASRYHSILNIFGVWPRKIMSKSTSKNLLTSLCKCFLYNWLIYLNAWLWRVILKAKCHLKINFPNCMLSVHPSSNINIFVVECWEINCFAFFFNVLFLHYALCMQCGASSYGSMSLILLLNNVYEVHLLWLWPWRILIFCQFLAKFWYFKTLLLISY